VQLWWRMPIAPLFSKLLLPYAERITPIEG
jgi:hypothetical protein